MKEGLPVSTLQVQPTSTTGKGGQKGLFSQQKFCPHSRKKSLQFVSFFLNSVNGRVILNRTEVAQELTCFLGYELKTGIVILLKSSGFNIYRGKNLQVADLFLFGVI